MGLFKKKKSSKVDLEEKNDFINKIQSYIDDEDRIVYDEGYFEWKVKHWDSLSDNNDSPRFSIGDNKWYINLRRPKENIFVDVINANITNNSYGHISTKIVMYIRNPYDCNCFIYKTSDFVNINKFHNNVNFIFPSSALNTTDNKQILERNKCIIGVFIRTYLFEKEFLLDEIKFKGEAKEGEIVNESYYEWKMTQGWELAEGLPIHSPKFIMDSKEWSLKITSNYNNPGYYYNVHIEIQDYNSDTSDTNYTDRRFVVYVRNRTDFSCFSSGVCHLNNGITFSFPKNTTDITPMEGKVCVMGIYLRSTYNKKDKFMNKIKDYINNEQQTVETEGSYEWTIENWDQISSEISSPEFIVGDYKWKLELLYNNSGENNFDFVKVNLANVNSNIDDFTHIRIKKVFYIRNCNDYSCFKLKDVNSFTYYNKNCNSTGCSLIQRPELYLKRGESNKSIIEDNQCIIGVYFRIYKYEKGRYIDEIKSLIKNVNKQIKGNGYYEWEVENWSQLTNEEYSPTFDVANYEWKLILYPNKQNNINIQLQNLNVESNELLKIDTSSVFFIRNTSDTLFIYKELPFTEYRKDNNCIGTDLIQKSELSMKRETSDNTLLENDKCIIGVFINTYKNEDDINNENENFNDLRDESMTKTIKEMKPSSEVKDDKELIKKNYQMSEIKDRIEAPTLVISKNDFFASEYDQLDIRKDEFLIVTNWDGPEGWVFGHRKNNEEEKGYFPKVFVEICNEDDNDISKLYQNQITPEYRIQFENKVNQLRSQESMKLSFFENKIFINRSNLLNASFDAIMNMSKDDMKKTLRIKYLGEEGIDAGGLLRDFFFHISKEIRNPDYLLLQPSPYNSYELEINPKSNIGNPLYLKHFKFIGRIIGLAILNQQNIPISFTIPLYKKLLEKTLEFYDLKFVDPDIYKNINWLNEHNGVDSLCLTFEIEEKDCFGNHHKIELKSNGANIDVSDSNKQEYIDLIVNKKLNNPDIEEQFQALKEGFYDVIPNNINTIIDEFDLKFLISGLNEIDVDDWENNTLYDGYTKDDPTIINFWKCVRELNNEKKSQLLLFATGSSQVPFTGFKDLQGNGNKQQFKLKKTGTINDLPISHTCFNRIDLPPYTSYTQLKQKLLRAIAEGINDFDRE